MQANKKQVEVLLMNYFRSCYTEFPKGKLVPTESPDFQVKMKNAHVLGIELTRLNPANAFPVSSNEKELIDFRERLIEGIKQQFERSCGIKLFVKFLFSEKNKITPEKELVLIIKTALLIKEAVLAKNEKHFFKVVVPQQKLPVAFDGISIIYHPGLEIPVWERSNNLGVSNNVVDDIHKAIHKKDEKLRLYQKQRLNYYWLLITTDRLRGIKGYNLSNKIKHVNFRSRFQHVFLFDLIKSKIHELV